MSDHELLQEYRAELRQDFCAFVVRCFHELNRDELAIAGHIGSPPSTMARSNA